MRRDTLTALIDELEKISSKNVRREVARIQEQVGSHGKGKRAQHGIHYAYRRADAQVAGKKIGEQMRGGLPGKPISSIERGKLWKGMASKSLKRALARPAGFVGRLPR